jgi:hypothetical protein
MEATLRQQHLRLGNSFAAGISSLLPCREIHGFLSGFEMLNRKSIEVTTKATEVATGLAVAQSSDSMSQTYHLGSIFTRREGTFLAHRVFIAVIEMEKPAIY